ncbi:FAD-dependent oxidoreductase [Blastococcus litoris]|uniref:FAD-dependent oxidoreductase n=1 Tax=Blastococcus litoris TaxID=2171622 RepID=UPI000E300285|nr:FAD-dependent oxidoreductase [Blastococcus litoris]
MTYVITQNCCKDATCVSACPVNCISPAPGTPEYAESPMLYIDPKVCIDCGACADVCPVDAAVPADSLGRAELVYAELNDRHHRTSSEQGTPEQVEGPLFHPWGAPSFDWTLPSDFRGVDVAVVGTGPAGLYAAELLLLHTGSVVTLIDRLPVAGGLIRYGVAPDHPSTKRIGETLGRLYSHPRVRLLLGVDVGEDVTVEQLSENFDAVVYAVGAATGRQLEVPGEDLPGVHSGPEFVGWYNAHPDVPAGDVQLTSERAIVIGTGNVALDVARILSTDPDELARTDIAEHALEALRRSPVREVLLLGRRGPEEAAYSAPELLALEHLPGVELVVEGSAPGVASTIDEAEPGSHAELLQGASRVAVETSAAPEPGRRIVLRFASAVERILGEDAAEGVCLTDGTVVLGSPVVSAIGYGGRAVIGLPFDEENGTVPNEAGRITGTPGSYAVGWFKRGSSGGIGDNRSDAAETVRSLLDDAVAGRLPKPAGSSRAFVKQVRRDVPDVLGVKELGRILRAEKGRARPEGGAVKLATAEELVRAGRGR